MGARRPGRRRSARIATAALACAVVWVLPGSARAANPDSFGGFARMVAPLVAAAPSQQAQQQEEPRRPPPIEDPASGPVFSIFGGSIFSGSSAFQTGATFAYFFGPKASVGVEAEGNLTFGPGGRVAQFMGSLVLQTGARTSKFVPYIAFGGGMLRATNEYPAATQEALVALGIDPEPDSETAPFFQFGGGLRFYFKPGLAFRADVRFAQVALDLEGLSFSESLFPMRRVAGMLSWDF